LPAFDFRLLICKAQGTRCEFFLHDLAMEEEKTIIMIAHRLKTVRHADQILVVDNGHIVQRGSHAELAAQDGIYKTFVEGRQEAASWKIA